MTIILDGGGGGGSVLGEKVQVVDFGQGRRDE